MPRLLRKPLRTTSVTVAGKSFCAFVCWGRYPMAPERREGARTISPAMGRSSPSRLFTSVDLPLPFSPTMHT